MALPQVVASLPFGVLLGVLNERRANATSANPVLAALF